MIYEQIAERVKERKAAQNVRRNGRLSFSVEYGRGETYANSDMTIYSHDEYERSSVLSGRDRRMWIASFPAEATEDDARETMRAAGVERITDFNLGGSSHVPIGQIVSHLPDDTEY